MTLGTVDPSHQEEGDKSTNEGSPFFKVDGRTFTTEEDLAHHIRSAQEYIKKLEADFESATKLISTQDQALSTSAKVEELLNAVANKQNTSRTAEETPKFSKEDVIAEALQSFEQRQVELSKLQQEQENYKTVNSALLNAFGDKTEEVVQRVATDNGMSVEEITEYAKRHPKLVLKMFDTKPATSAKPNLSSYNTEVLANRPPEGPRKSFLSLSAKEKAAEIQRRLAALETN